MMSFAAYTSYNWFIFIWGSIGMLFIAAVSIREIVEQVKIARRQGKPLSKTGESGM
ncbi:hypothetical protein [Brevibacillus borstelensis]|uniref:hypothetical protein n=1 Tax=Brevibacillus borstelensis TaxID=45462 RepID=UPI0030BD05C9